MKILLTLTLMAMFFGSISQARIHAEIISTSKIVTLAATPEPIAISGIFSDDVIIQAKSTNTVAAFVGPCSGSQDVELAVGASIGIADITNIDSKVGINLNKICLKVGVNGEGANIMYSKIVSQ